MKLALNSGCFWDRHRSSNIYPMPVSAWGLASLKSDNMTSRVVSKLKVIRRNACNETIMEYMITRHTTLIFWQKWMTEIAVGVYPMICTLTAKDAVLYCCCKSDGNIVESVNNKTNNNNNNGDDVSNNNRTYNDNNDNDNISSDDNGNKNYDNDDNIMIIMIATITTIITITIKIRLMLMLITMTMTIAITMNKKWKIIPASRQWPATSPMET